MSARDSKGLSRVTLRTLAAHKRNGERFAVLTAYDAGFAAVIEGAGVEVVLVGDSLGMVFQGHSSTLPVTMEQMIYHTRAAAAGCSRALLMADMPFMSANTPDQALANAGRLMQEGGAQIVKLEGGAAQVETVSRLAQHGIPVCAHLGLQPQSVHKLGGHRVQGRGQEQASAMLEDARSLQQAGADLLLLECVPRALAREITAEAEVPVIGIGAGPDCDAQVLVLYDLLGITSGRMPKFSHCFLEAGRTIPQAVEAYVQAVKEGTFPAVEHCFD